MPKIYASVSTFPQIFSLHRLLSTLIKLWPKKYEADEIIGSRELREERWFQVILKRSLGIGSFI